VTNPEKFSARAADDAQLSSGGTSPGLAKEIEALGHRMEMVRDRIGRIIFGQKNVIDETLITLLAGGHALLIGFPGLGKTLLVETLGAVLGTTNVCNSRLI